MESITGSVNIVFTLMTISKVLLACCANVFLLEAISREAPGSANLITFTQFLCVAIQGFLSHLYHGRPRLIPLSEYAKLVILFFFVSTGNNYALNFNISVPLHVIFKSGSLLANLVLGILILRRRYSFSKYFAVILITIGIILCTIASYDPSVGSSKGENDQRHFHTWILGLTILTVVLFTSAFMGIFQEKLYAKYGRHHEEVLFFCHLLPLPGFLLLWPDLVQQVKIFSQSPSISLFFPQNQVPRLFIYLFLNSMTQLICVSSVFKLTSQHTSLTVTLVITLRKFFSLMISTIYFGSLLTFNHWLGIVLVFSGTLLFTEIHKQLSRPTLKDSSKKLR
ncbi:UDP-xylose and UDP-N-acetylglucosamine transporter-like [Brevipalpus obovatus]|uniref:UDP-xylose and UDP-N-acetylglucosamine transporter-like n=1 Tax=Brevipalpus obovatus TaxID=246614 RepID=UPI003D9E1525